MEEQNNEELSQGYIDKVYNALLETGKTMNRVLLLLVFFSFVNICLSIGIVSVSQDVTIFGLKFTFQSWLILIGGSLIIATLYVYLLTLSTVNASLRQVVHEFYSDTKLRGAVVSWNIVSPDILTITLYILFTPVLTTNYRDPLAVWLGENPRDLPKLSLFPRFRNAFNLFVLMITSMLLFLFPISALVAACIKMVVLFKGIWWVWFSFGLLFVICIGYLISYIGGLIERIYNASKLYKIPATS